MQSDFFERSPDIVEGIGEGRARLLREARITSLADMLARGPRVVHQLLSGTSPKQVVRWFAATLLLQVEDVDPQLAEALVDGGVSTIKQLATCGLQTLERAVASAREAGKIREAPSLYQLAAIQRDAATLRGKGIAQGRVLQADSGAPLPNLRVSVGRLAAVTDPEGRFILSGVPTETRTATLEVPGRGRVSVRLVVRSGPYVPTITYRAPAPAAPRRGPVRESEGALIWLGRDSRLRLIDSELAVLPDNTYVLVANIRRDGRARLLHLYRHKIQAEVRAERVHVDAVVLPEGTRAGEVLRYHAGALTRTDLTLLDVARRKLQPIVGDRELRPLRQLMSRRLGG